MYNAPPIMHAVVLKRQQYIHTFVHACLQLQIVTFYRRWNLCEGYCSINSKLPWYNNTHPHSIAWWWVGHHQYHCWKRMCSCASADTSACMRCTGTIRLRNNPTRPETAELNFDLYTCRIILKYFLGLLALDE